MPFRVPSALNRYRASMLTPSSHIRTILIALTIAAGLPVPALSRAQARDPSASSGPLTVQVRDTLGGTLPGATVTIRAPETSTDPTTWITDVNGRADVTPLPPGRYQVTVELQGFEPAIADIETIPGRPLIHSVTLAIAGVVEQVTVQVDETARRLADSFTETLTAEQIDQLPDDPEEAAALISELAGPGAEIRINGFEGGELPPKSQIQAIRVRHDPFAPDGGGAGRPRVDVITKPGSSEWTHSFNAGLRDQSIDARNPFASERGEGQTRRLRWSSSGPIIRNRTSIAFNLMTRNAFDVQPIVARTGNGEVHDSINQRNDQLNAEIRLEHALGAAHTLRVEYQRRAGERANLGVGEFSLPERAYDTTNEFHLVRFSNIGTFGKKAFNELRVESAWRAEDAQSRSQAVTVDVASAFTSGGAQRAGGTREVPDGDRRRFSKSPSATATSSESASRRSSAGFAAAAARMPTAASCFPVWTPTPRDVPFSSCSRPAMPLWRTPVTR